MIPSTYFWLCLLFLALGTITIRGSIIFASSRLKITPRVKELFTFIPAAILPAFIVPSSFYNVGHVAPLMGKERLFVLIGAAAICLWTRSTLATIVFGLVSLYLLVQFF